MNVRDLEPFFSRTEHRETVEFEDFFPSDTRGDGKPIKNNFRTGAAQGKSNLLRKAHCWICGYPVDLSVIDHTGGSLDGNGAGGPITNATVTYTLTNGTTATENYGTQAYRQAAGCPLCFSKNSTKDRNVLLQDINPWDLGPAPLGF